MSARKVPTKDGVRQEPPDPTYHIGIPGSGGVTDHGALTGLADDDHSQYALDADLAGYQPLDATLTALAALDNTAGLLEQTGADTFARRALGVGASTSVPTRGDADSRYAAASHGIHITDGDKGDVTVGSSGTTLTIDGRAVTFAKMQAIGSNRLLGRDTAGSGDIEELQAGVGLEFTDAGALRREAISGDVVVPNTNNTATIQADAVTYAKMQDVSAGSKLLGRGDSGAGDPQEITVGSGLSMSGTTLSATGGPGGEAFPVGSIYLAVVSTNPATLLGYGTWSAIGAGRVLVGLDSGDTDFDTVEETGGAKTKAISAHTGTAVANHASHTHTYTEVPNHVHLVERFPTATGASTGFTVDTSMSGTPTNTAQNTANPTGGVATGTTNGPNATLTHSVTQPDNHTNLNVVQPYFVCYMWKRTA